MQPSNPFHPYQQDVAVRYRTLLEGIDGFVFIVSSQGAYLDLKRSVNSYRLWRHPDDFFGRTLEEVLPPTLAEPRRYYLDKAHRTGRECRYNQKFVSPLGVRDYNILIHPMGWDELLIIVRDRPYNVPEFLEKV